MQKEITAIGPLHDQNGRLLETGYARRLLRAYDRRRLASSTLRVREWDRYLITSDRYALSLAIADNGWVGLDSVSLMDFDDSWEKTFTQSCKMPLGRRGLSATSEQGGCAVSGKGYALAFENDGKTRRLFGHIEDFADREPLLFDITLWGAPQESAVLVTPFPQDAKAFAYTQKINGMKAAGKALLGEREYLFAPAHSFAVLDWGRGVWPYHSARLWASASGLAAGVPFGLNLAGGVGDAPANENMLFYAGKAHKLGRVEFGIPPLAGRDAAAPWRFSADDGRLEMAFAPILDSTRRMNRWPVRCGRRLVCGGFTGFAVLDDGRKIAVKDLVGVVENAFYRG